MRRSRRRVHHPRRFDWTSYLDAFHASRPGITEDVLTASRTSTGFTPYEWVVAPIGAGMRVLDIACGSGPCMDVRKSESWIGLDRSIEELGRARSNGRALLVRGDATALPFRSGSFDVVVCSMALMLVQPFSRMIGEVNRVLCDGATFVFMMPGRRPLRARDVVRYARLVRRLGRWQLRYPNDGELRHLVSLFDEFGFDVLDDARERFGFQLRTTDDADRFVQSLYLPKVTPVEVERGIALATTWVGTEIGIPLRRIIARKRPHESRASRYSNSE